MAASAAFPSQPRCRIIAIGLGFTGSAVARAIAALPGLDIVAAVDTDEAKIGLDLAELLGAEPLRGAKVFGELSQALDHVHADLAIHCVGSRIAECLPTITAAVLAGLNVISTCEELAYPFFHHPDQADELDQAAKDAGVTVLGCGVNPGHVLDVLPALLARTSLDITRVVASRIVDVSTRREQLVRKVGVGLSEEEFRERAERGEVGHVGLPESAAMVADALGFWPVEVTHSLEPVLATMPTPLGEREIAAGRVLGVRQRAEAYRGPSVAVQLNLELYVGALQPEDRLRVEGEPEVELVIPGGTPGDEATVAIVINTIPAVLTAPPGLITMIDLPARRTPRR